MRRLSLLFQKPLVAIGSLVLAVLYSITMPLLALLMQWITNSLVENQGIDFFQIFICLGFAIGIFILSAVYVLTKYRLINFIITN